MLEHRLNKYVIRDNGKYPNSKLEFSKLDTRDMQRDATVVETLFGMGAMSPNEVIDTFKEYFNLGGVVDHPAMNLHYMGGKPIDTDDEVQEEEDILARIESTLGALSGNGNGNGQAALPAVVDEGDAEE